MVLENVDLSNSLRYCNPIATFNWSPALSKNPAVYIDLHIIIVIIVMNDSLGPFSTHAYTDALTSILYSCMH